MIARIDLETLTFTQAQVLELVPSLSAKTLQNWNERGILDGPQPGRKGKRRQYTALGVIALRFMADVVALGVQPGDAFEMAEQLAERALEVHADYPHVEEHDGHLWWTIIPGDKYLTQRVNKVDGKYVLRNNSDLPFEPHIFITVETDLLVMQMLNRIYRLLAGKPKEA